MKPAAVVLIAATTVVTLWALWETRDAWPWPDWRVRRLLADIYAAQAAYRAGADPADGAPREVV